MMKKGYVIAEVRVTNPGGYEEYRPLSAATVAQYGGKFLVRGGQRAQREGADPAHNEEWRTVIIEFPSIQQAQAWYDSPEYSAAIKIRHANSIGRLCIVEGI